MQWVNATTSKCYSSLFVGPITSPILYIEKVDSSAKHIIIIAFVNCSCWITTLTKNPSRKNTSLSQCCFDNPLDSCRRFTSPHRTGYVWAVLTRLLNHRLNIIWKLVRGYSMLSVVPNSSSKLIRGT